MSRNRFQNVAQVAAQRLCMGCGACVPACPAGNITLVDVPDQGLRPQINAQNCQHCGACVNVCAGLAIAHKPFNGEIMGELRQAWGPVREMWEGYACDPEIRYLGSSGGVATALALYCLQEAAMAGVLHIGSDRAKPWKNAAVFSHTREELLACTGSRYAPAAP